MELDPLRYSSRGRFGYNPYEEEEPEEHEVMCGCRDCKDEEAAMTPERRERKRQMRKEYAASL